MSQRQDYTAKPATAADIPADWIVNVREIVLRDGHAVRAGFPEITIEIQNINQPEVWQPLNLPTNSPLFATEQDRDHVLEQLWTATL